MTPPHTVLLIEDNETQREALAQLLQDKGYVVRQATDCAAGLEFVRQETPQAILLDWVLPGMSGWDFLKNLRRNPDAAAVPIAVISGYPERAEQASILSGIAFLAKPVEEGRLFTVLENFISKPQPEILLVDDEPVVAEVIAFNLRHHGLAVRQVNEGRDGLEVYRRFQDRISLVLLDVQMPDLDGPQLFAQMRQINPAVKVVFISGHTGDYSVEELLKAGALRVLQKPFPFMNKLAELLRQLASK